MPYNIAITNATRNQATATYTFKKICLFDNRFVEGTFTNTTGGSLDLTPGMLIVRSASVVGGFEVATFTDATTNTVKNVIGIAVQEGIVTLANNATSFINIVVEGTVDGTELILPAGCTLDTVIGGKSVEDILNAIGPHVDRSGVEQTKTEN